MGLAASQGRLLLLTAKRSDLEFRAQQISQKRLVLAQQLEGISRDYEEATSNRQMKIRLNATGEGADAAPVNQNLTYERLMASTWENSSFTNISRPEYANAPDYKSTQFYKLVDASGATVISDLSEIPNRLATTTTYPKITEDPNAKKTVDATNDFSYYRSYNKSSADGDYNYTGAAYYVAPKTGADGKNTALYEALIGSDKKDSDNIPAEFDTKLGIVKYGDNFYNMNTGEKITLDEGKDKPDGFDSIANGQLDGGVALQLAASEKAIETKTSSNKVELTGGEPVAKGNDGYYEVTFGEGTANQTTITYYVDPHLKNESTSEPGYLQDCLRNSKYLIQVGKTNEEENNEFQWKYVSWDATSAISDSYYTDDDEAAKAKYDRLQAEIQNQDKKLELELDDIETQRSAVTTEIESVEKVINDDIDSTFKTFNA